MKLLIVQLPPFSCYSLFGPNILLRTLFSNTLSLCSSLNVRASFTPIQNNLQYHGFVYFIIYVPKQQAGRQTTGPNGRKQNTKMIQNDLL
jgi:hypothetical protein